MERTSCHYLSKVKSSGFPKRIIMLNVRPIYAAMADNQAASTCSYDVWEAVVLDGLDGNYESSEHVDYPNNWDVWQYIRNAMLPKTTTWLMGFGIAFQLSLTGFWKLLEERKWTLTNTMPVKLQNYAQELTMLSTGTDCTEKQTMQSNSPKQQRNWQSCCVISDPPTIVVCRPANSKATLKIVDVRNYGVDTPERDKDGHISIGLLADWAIGFTSAIKRSNLGGLQASAAAQAMHGYRHTMLDIPILVHNNSKCLRLERDAVASGRNECYRIGVKRGDVYHLDFNSYYPAVARTNYFPVRLAGHGEVTLDAILRKQSSGYSVMADVHLAAASPIYPKKIDSRICFPTGEFRATLAAPELELAIERNEILKVYHAAWYEQEKPFTKWVDYLWAMRNESEQRKDKPAAECYKRLCNCLFGKFAQWAWQWTSVDGVEPSGPYSIWWGARQEDIDAIEQYNSQADPKELRKTIPAESYVRFRSIGWNVECENIRSEHRDSVCSIAAHLYALARVRLWHTMVAAGLDNVYYVDTDSLWVNQAGYRTLDRCGLIGDNELGALKLVAIHPWVRLIGLKHYELPTQQIHAGLPAGSKRIGDWRWEFFSGERMAGALAQGRAPQPIAVRHTTSSVATYRHGVVDKAGRVRPFHLKEEIYNERSRERDSLEAIADSITEQLRQQEIFDKRSHAR